MGSRPLPSAVFSPRRRTAVVLAGEGTQAAYLAGVMRALDAAGVRIDVVLGKGAGALVAAFSAFHAEEKIYGEGGLLEAFERERPFRVAPLCRVAAVCLGAAFAVFLSPALLGVASIVAFPVQALLRQWRPEGGGAAGSLLSGVAAAAEPYYFPAIALPVVALFVVLAARSLGSIWRGRREGFAPVSKRLLHPSLDLAPLARMLEGRLWQLVRGTSTDERPRDRRALSEAYVQLLTAGLGQHGFRELVFYALDTDRGAEVPFVALKDRFSKKLAGGDERERPAKGARAEPIDFAGEGSAIFFDALLAALSPPGLVPEVAIKLPRGNEFGGEVHRFASSLVASGDGAGVVADALALGAEQILYVSGAGCDERVEGSIWERLASRALRAGVENDLAFASAATDVPVFVIRPDWERLSPFEFSGRAQLGGERLTPTALVAQGERDTDKLFIRPVLGEELPAAPAETTIPIDRNWERGPKEL